MKKRVFLAAVGVLLVAGMTGCDEATLSGLSSSPATKATVAKLFGNGDVVGDQLWQRDRLQDGSGGNCLDPENPGTCDGSGPFGSGEGGNGGTGYGGSGNGDQDRLRDGSCL